MSEAPHLFESNAGGGAAGNGAGGVGGGKASLKNPFAEATWNLTEQRNGPKLFHLILHLNLHLTSNTRAMNEQWRAVTERTQKSLAPL